MSCHDNKGNNDGDRYLETMGLLDSLATWLGLKQKQAKVICVGLDNSGKSTIINHLKPESTKAHNVIPTIGFNVEVFKHDSISFTVWDMSGQGRYRNLWEHYYDEVEAVMFVLDSSDKLRMPVAQEELKTLLSHSKIIDRNIPILLLANKMDVRGSLTAIQCSRAMELDTLAKERSYYICSTNALTGDGLSEAVQWLTDQLKNKSSQR